MAHFAILKKLMFGSLIAVGIAACGGGSAGDGGILGGGAADEEELLTWNEGVFFEKTVYENFCEEPRTGQNPFNNNHPFPDKQGTVAHENFYLRSWTNELYLWYDEVEDQDPNLFSTPDYFDALRTLELTPSGNLKDNFHFTENTESYLTRTVSGVTFGYGMSLVFRSLTPPRQVIVRDIVTGSPADLAGVQRGMELTFVDGADLVNGGDQATVDVLNAGLFPDESGETHTFIFEPVDGGDPLEAAMDSGTISTEPVKAVSVVDTETGGVGYIHFSSHTEPSEADLFEAFNTLETEGVTDLVLDLRYNGGGRLYIASQVGYMIAGAQSQGDTFFQILFNDQHPNTDPVTGRPLEPTPFYNGASENNDLVSEGTALPTLNLSRVFVLSSSGTCSASEAIINGLLGIDVEVILIGDTTCGKPYGFYPQDNCGTTYFSVQFTGANEKGFGEYPDGFSPSNMTNPPGVPVTGCMVADDFSKLLGDPEEAMFAAALQYRESGTCPTVAVSTKTAPDTVQQKTGLGLPIDVPDYPGLTNTILSPSPF